MSITPDGFEDTTEDLDWLDDDSGVKLAAFERDMREGGFHLWPDSMPLGWPRLDRHYEYEAYGPLLYSRPACRARHRLLWRLFCWTPRWLLRVWGE